MSGNSPNPNDDQIFAARCELLAAKLNARIAEAVPQPALEPGAVLGEFVVGDCIGRGGMGEVYLATQTRFNRTVAIKTVRSNAKLDRQARQRFETEIAMWGRVPPGDHVVRAISAGESAGLLYFAMEYVEGRSLAELSKEAYRSGGKPLDPLVVCDYLRQASLGVASAHEQGVIHRDLKPSNLMLKADGRVVVLDLGLARVLTAVETPSDGSDGPLAAAGAAGTTDGNDEQEPTLTQPNQRLGTPAYAAPEQVQGGLVDARTDVYGLGATLYKLLTGESPNGRPKNPLALRPDLPRSLATFVAKTLEVDPANRPASAREFAAELTRMPHKVAWERRRRRAAWPLTAVTLAVLVWGLIHQLGSRGPSDLPPDSAPPVTEFDDAPPEPDSSWMPLRERTLATDFEREDEEAWKRHWNPDRAFNAAGEFSEIGHGQNVMLLETPWARSGRRSLRFTHVQGIKNLEGKSQIQFEMGAEGVDRVRVEMWTRFEEPIVQVSNVHVLSCVSTDVTGQWNAFGVHCSLQPPSPELAPSIPIAPQTLFVVGELRWPSGTMPLFSAPFSPKPGAWRRWQLEVKVGKSLPKRIQTRLQIDDELVGNGDAGLNTVPLENRINHVLLGGYFRLTSPSDDMPFLMDDVKIEAWNRAR